MPFDLHTVECPDGFPPARSDRIILAQQTVANASGVAGAAVTTAVAVPGGLPTPYSVIVTPSQACFVSVTSKTSNGFNVTLTPLYNGANTAIAAGSFDVVVLA
jgi:hypothetical protein